jgi:hypothetical protein
MLAKKAADKAKQVKVLKSDHLYFLEDSLLKRGHLYFKRLLFLKRG